MARIRDRKQCVGPCHFNIFLGGQGGVKAFIKCFYPRDGHYENWV